jgi:hypothetical protein
MSNRQPDIEWFCMTVMVTSLTLLFLPSLLEFYGSKVCARSQIKQSSGKMFVSNIIAVQKSYYREYGHFASVRTDLSEIGASSHIPTDVEKYWKISIQTKDDTTFAYAVAKDGNQKMYSYVAAATAYGRNDNDQWKSTICRTLEPSTTQPAAPILQGSQKFIFWRHDAKLICSSGTEDC